MLKAWQLTTVSALLAAELTAGMRTYRQTLEVTCSSPEAAAQMRLTALPLPVGKRVAFSTRWDDSIPPGVEMAEVLAAHGYKGTFYLNKVDQGYGGSVIQKLLDMGCSVGSHTCSHPSLPKLDPNTIFKEILANRIAVETAGDTCVVAFTLPFMDYSSPADPRMPWKICDCLLRAGLRGGAEVWPDVATKFQHQPQEWIGANTFDINDADPQPDLFRKAVKHALQSIAAKGFECGPHMVLGIHCWQNLKDPNGLVRFGEIIQTEANHPDWWYCNENEYVAYRMQMFHSVIMKTGVAGNTATFSVDRVVPFELGDRVALGLQASPVPLRVSVGKHPATLSENGAFMLRHDAAQQLPARVVTIANNDNRSGADVSLSDTALPGLQLGLQVSLKKNLLSCTLKNASEAAFKNVSLTFRIPPKWKKGVAVKDFGELNVGEARLIEIALGDREADASYNEGALFFAVQCDLTDAQGPARAYGTTEVTAEKTLKKSAL